MGPDQLEEIDDPRLDDLEQIVPPYFQVLGEQPDDALLESGIDHDRPLASQGPHQRFGQRRPRIRFLDVKISPMLQGAVLVQDVVRPLKGHLLEGTGPRKSG